MNKILTSILYLVCGLFIVLFCSCVNSDAPTTDYKEVNKNLDSYLQTKTVDITVPDGQTAVVTVGGDTLSVTDVAKKVLVPKSIKPDVTYVDAKNKLQNKDSYWEVIAFEDSKKGDYDYNDLVIHVKYTLTSDGKFFLGIQPVAYGATKQIDLGYEIYDNKTNEMLASGYVTNTRKALFLDGSDSGFINTSRYQRHYDGYTYSIDKQFSEKNLSSLSVVWYIMVDNNQIIYALNKVNAENVDLFNNTGYPYSLVLSGLNNGKKYTQPGFGNCGHDWFQFPLETIDIRSCYDIKAWLASGDKYLDDFILPTAQVIDVNEYGKVSNKRIYEETGPFRKIDSYEEN